MLICAIDTSGRDGSVALAQGDANSFELLYAAPIAGGTYSSQLIPQISDGLQSAGCTKSEIGLLVAASGPGSFTGLRVGLSTVKAFAEVLAAPIVACSVLEAIAFAVPARGVLLSALDAQRNELFVGEYESSGNQQVPPVLIQEALVAAGDFTTWLGRRESSVMTFTPDASIASKLGEAGVKVELVARPNAETYARLGRRKFLLGQATPADILDANYIRRSDAEIFSSPNRK